MNDINHVNQLLMLNGASFVEQAYRQFLKRSPDRGGREHFLARLRNGDSKEMIVHAIASSPEARTMRSTLDGMSEFNERFERSKKAAKSSPGAEQIGRSLNRMEFGFGQSQDKILERLGAIEATLEDLQRAAVNTIIVASSGPATATSDRPEAKVSIKRGVALADFKAPADFILDLQGKIRNSAEASAFASSAQ
ncbi:DUF4214 domain-containing protein [Sphingomonas sp. RB3P16]|uniref:DUF4214 domain-containing protein n=1 Tax=Parasphingomonas frigoris TaxID=3096163 RepID=UPI002FC7C0BB